MLDRQFEDFEVQERLLDATLGLLGFVRTIEALAAAPRAAGGPRPRDDLTDFFLGLLAAGRTLQAIAGAELGRDGERPAPRGPSDPRRELSLR